MVLRKQIWLVRHAESLAQAGLSDDPVDSPLSPLGERQAQALRGRLAGEAVFDRVYVSPLRRAVRTFELSDPPRVRAGYDSRICEIPEGEGWYARMPPADLPELAEPDPHRAWEIAPARRVAELVEELCASPEARVLVYGHQGIFRYFFQAYTGLGAGWEGNSLPLLSDNTGIHMLEIHGDGRRHVRCWNEHRHALDLLNVRKP